MAKKRKETHSATLHDFFSRSAANKKPKVEELVVGLKNKKKDRLRTVPTHEIIVIDSDEEVEANIAVDPSTSRRARESVASKAVDVGPKTSFSSGLTLKVDSSLFGKPSALLPFDTPGSKTKADPRESSPFGIPSLLLPSNAYSSCTIFRNGSAKAEAVESCSTSISGPSTVRTDAELEEIDISQGDWAMGDDELDFANGHVNAEPDGFEDVDIDLTVDDSDSSANFGGPDVQECPLCGKQLVGLDIVAIHEHVNRCIDTVSSPKGNASADTRNILKPSSSLQTLDARSCIAHPMKKEFSSSKSVDGGGIFSRMMVSNQENEAWKEASVLEERLSTGRRGRRKAPFYKVMQGMPIAVDAFCYGTIPGVTAYFLTHAHSDHYTNLSSKWNSGPIYCSEGTANLIIHMLDVDRKWVHPLPMDVLTVIPDTGGVSVTLIEANHCPGSCLFLFEGFQTVNAGDSAFKSPSVGTSRTFRYLHCGDFRASPQHVLHPAIKGKRLDHVYLDTTYLDPKYCFPSQPQMISACAELARRIVTGQPLRDPGDLNAKKSPTMDKWITVQEKPADKKEEKPGRVLVVVGTYSIGKERIVKAIARELNTQVYCDTRKTAILRCQPDPELHSMLTTDPIKAGIHLVPLAVIASDRLKTYVERWKGHFSKAVGFRPTGWTYTPPSGAEPMPTISSVISRSQSRTFTHAHLIPTKNSTATLQVYGVPYSEHSSFFELTCFALSLDWVKMIATVNVGSENSRRKMAKWIERWEAERKKKGTVEIVSHRAEDYW